MNILRRLYLSERNCSYCGKRLNGETQGYVCDSCLGSIKPYHPINYVSLEFISSYRVFGLYKGALSHSLKLVKFENVKPLAYSLGRTVGEHLKEFMEETHPDLVTYVPTHFIRRWRRGFDQNEEILRSAQVNFSKLLLRVKHSKPMARLRKKERLTAVRNAFSVKKEFLDRIEGKKILVFDDILTTGATSTSVAELLLSLGAFEVYFYFMAKESE